MTDFLTGILYEPREEHSDGLTAGQEVKALQECKVSSMLVDRGYELSWEGWRPSYLKS